MFAGLGFSAFVVYIYLLVFGSYIFLYYYFDDTWFGVGCFELAGVCVVGIVYLGCMNFGYFLVFRADCDG